MAWLFRWYEVVRASLLRLTDYSLQYARVQTVNVVDWQDTEIMGMLS